MRLSGQNARAERPRRILFALVCVLLVVAASTLRVAHIHAGGADTADQEAQAGFACNGVKATLGSPLPSTCPVSEFTSSLLSIPAPNAENDDHNPPRVAPRNLFDLTVGEDNLLHRAASDKRTLSASMTVVNLTNKYALYNFLSTFSGTHFVTPRSITGQVAYHF